MREFKDLKIAVAGTGSIIEKYEMEEYKENLVEDQINGAYNYLSDLMMLHLFTDTRKKKVSNG